MLEDLNNDSEPEAGASLYRQNPATLRQFADKVRFDFGRRQQLLTLADAFDRLAARLEARVAD